MKTGILTLPLHTNYGGILQAFALQTILERLGHEVQLIDLDLRPYKSPMKRPFTYIKRLLKKIRGEEVDIMYEKHIRQEDAIIKQHTNAFIGKYIHRLLVRNYEDVPDIFDAIVVGSDQVWRPKYFWRDIKHAYLYFARDWEIKRVAYSVSFGTDDWEYTDEQTETCSTLARRFDAVSVRESGGIRLCMEHLHIKACQLLDPTLLLDADFYAGIVKNANTTECGGNLMCYILDDNPEKTELIRRIAKERGGLLPFRSNSLEGHEDEPLEKWIQPPVEQWLRSFMDAEFVISDSFHACIFSIIFKKQFIVIANVDRGLARFTSLLKMFGLEDRMLTSSDQPLPAGDIDYGPVHEKLDALRKKSIDFLSENLS